MNKKIYLEHFSSSLTALAQSIFDQVNTTWLGSEFAQQQVHLGSLCKNVVPIRKVGKNLFLNALICFI